MTLRHLSSERGQAILEAVFILMILVTLLFAIQYSGRLRANALTLLGESSYASFIESSQRISRSASSLTTRLKQTSLLPIFTEQLLALQGEGLIQVRRSQSQAFEDRYAANRIFKDVPLQRTSYLYVNEGHSLTVQENQSRIAHSQVAWRDTFGPTHALLVPIARPLARIDTPWRRDRLKTDWLSGWGGQSPAAPRTGPRR
jgi:hypothetical protein